MPNRADLEAVRRISERTAAGYEVLLASYREAIEACEAYVYGKTEPREVERMMLAAINKATQK